MEYTKQKRQHENEFAQKLEKLVGRRFETIQALNDFLKDYLGSKDNIHLELAYQNWEREHTPDFNLIGCCETDLVYCDIDIYFLWDRENNLYITEVGYEFN